jgi:hypothetical protein
VGDTLWAMTVLRPANYFGKEFSSRRQSQITYIDSAILILVLKVGDISDFLSSFFLFYFFCIVKKVQNFISYIQNGSYVMLPPANISHYTSVYSLQSNTTESIHLFMHWRDSWKNPSQIKWVMSLYSCINSTQLIVSSHSV